MDVKAWLETTGLSVAEEAFANKPAYPCVTFTNNAQLTHLTLTADKMVNNLSIYLFAAKIDTANETIIEALLDDVPARYQRTREWNQGEACFVTTYSTVIEEFL